MVFSVRGVVLDCIDSQSLSSSLRLLYGPRCEQIWSVHELSACKYIRFTRNGTPYIFAGIAQQLDLNMPTFFLWHCYNTQGLCA